MEPARRCVRERTELLSDRVGLTNRIGTVLATLGVNDYNPLLQSRRRRLGDGCADEFSRDSGPNPSHAVCFCRRRRCILTLLPALEPRFTFHGADVVEVLDKLLCADLVRASEEI